MSIGTASYIALLKQPIRKRLFTGMALQALQQLTGVNFIFVSLFFHHPMLILSDDVVVLWNQLLQELGYLEPLHCLGHHLTCQHPVYRSWSLHGREMGSSTTPHVRRCRYVGVPTDCRRYRHRSTRFRIRQQGSHRFCLHLHLLLRVQLGSLVSVCTLDQFLRSD
jgi:hypothetical protein